MFKKRVNARHGGVNWKLQITQLQLLVDIRARTSDLETDVTHKESWAVCEQN